MFYFHDFKLEKIKDKKFKYGLNHNTQTSFQINPKSKNILKSSSPELLNLKLTIGKHNLGYF